MTESVSTLYLEVSFLVFLSLLGMFAGAIVKACGIWFIAFASYAVGLALALLMGVVFLVTGVALSATAFLGALVLLTVLLAFYHWRQRTFLRRDVVALAVVLLGFTVVAIGLGYRDFMVSSVDSLWMQRAGEIIAYTGGVDKSVDVLARSSVFNVLVQAFASLLGLEYFAAFYPCLLFPLVMCFVYLCRAMLLEAGVSPRLAVGFSILGAACVATSPFTIWNAYYVNGHLATALYLMLCVGTIAVASLRKNDNWLFFAALSCITLVLLRFESIIVAGVILVFLLPVTDCTHRVKVWFAASVTLVAIVWYGFLYGLLAPSMLLDEKLFVMLGGLVAVTALLSLSKRRLVMSVLTRAPEITVVVGGLVVLSMFLVRPEHMLPSIHALVANVVGGQSHWGAEWLFVLPLLLLSAVLTTKRSIQRSTLLLILGYVLLLLVLVYFRAPYRVSLWDSANRVLLHMFPVALLYLTVSWSSALYGSREPKERRTD